MIAANLPALQVVVPLMGAPLCVLLRRRNLAWGFATLISWAAFAAAVALLGQVLDSGPLSYELGGWAVPWGIEYRVDVVNGFVLLIVAGIGAAALPFARASVTFEIPADRHHLFYAAYLLAIAGLLGIVITGDAFNLFVFLEISSLASYALVGLGRDRRALAAAFRYLVMGTIGATFILIGIGFLYMTTGTLNIGDLAERVAPLSDNRTVRAAFAFLVVGVSLKLALFPLHLWLPDAYAYAPSVVTVLLAGTATKVALYVLLRLFFTLFGAAFSFGTMSLGTVLLPLAMIAMVSGSLVALFQQDVKRMLAYSSVAQIGYIVLGISFASVTGLTAGIVHMFNHALMKGALFMCLGSVFLRIGSVQLADLAGVAQRMPFTMFAFVLAGLSLIGIPLTVGFVSKWYLILAALEAGWWPLAVVIVASSLLAVGYIWRVVEAAYFRPAPAATEGPREAPLSMLVPSWLLVGACIYFGVDTSLTLGVAERAAQFLLDGAP